MTEPSEPSGQTPLRFTMRNRCPRCGQGTLYAGPLKLAGGCAVCGLDFSPYDQGDGPAPFAIFLVGGLVVLGMYLLDTIFAPPFWVHAVIWIPAIVVLSLISLRLLKSWLVAEHYRNDAREGKLGD